MTDEELLEFNADMIEAEGGKPLGLYYAGCNYYFSKDPTVGVSMHDCDACFFETPTQFALCSDKKPTPAWRIKEG